MTMLNCPFCGSEAKHHYKKGTTSWGTVSCSNKDCPCRSHFHPQQWNERHDATKPTECKLNLENEHG